MAKEKKEYSEIIKTKAFILTSIVFGAVFFVSIITISCEYYLKMGVSFDFGVNGWATFMSLYDFPAKVGAAYLAVVGLIGLNHRSAQTKKQLELASNQVAISAEQNGFTNYYKHLEEFEKYVESKGIKDIDTRLAHRTIFPDCMNGANYQVTRELFNELGDSVAYCLAITAKYAKSGGSYDERLAYRKTSLTLRATSLATVGVSEHDLIQGFKEEGDALRNSKALSIALMQQMAKAIELYMFDTSFHSEGVVVCHETLKGHCKLLISSTQRPSVDGYEVLNMEPEELNLDDFLFHMPLVISSLNICCGNDHSKYLNL